MLEAPMRRFPLRLKIAGFAAGLILLATALVALFTVILPWRAKLKAQERLASQLVKTALPLGIDLRAEGASFDPAPLPAPAANPSPVHAAAPLSPPTPAPTPTPPSPAPPPPTPL